jgi:hypothetical protein
MHTSTARRLTVYISHNDVSKTQLHHDGNNIKSAMLSLDKNKVMAMFYLRLSQRWLWRILSSGPLWSSGQSSCLQIQRSGFNSQRYQIFWEVVGLELGPLSLVSTTEELFER